MDITCFLNFSFLSFSFSVSAHSRSLFLTMCFRSFRFTSAPSYPPINKYRAVQSRHKLTIIIIIRANTVGSHSRKRQCSFTQFTQKRKKTCKNSPSFVLVLSLHPSHFCSSSPRDDYSTLRPCAGVGFRMKSEVVENNAGRVEETPSLTSVAEDSPLLPSADFCGLIKLRRGVVNDVAKMLRPVRDSRARCEVRLLPKPHRTCAGGCPLPSLNSLWSPSPLW
ncbi:unnamed protein product [Trypanosoma congolense IL3000]|uniref:WGS project CAEQ00000000 data, annotated contig 357 n=1 Tax=Trypanosoma congolense (strain IL3000) TaxID=1068625 RepID=F9WF76_TRYCI|nr:unnamed protein product [Trypanosoma congolense IL3000]